MEKAYRAREHGKLWPPIADSLDTYYRRRACEADAYELTWRLIHVWEAVSITLSIAAASRARELSTDNPVALKVFQSCKEHYHGKNWDSVTETFNTTQGALDGSASRRIDILWEFSRFNDPPSGFLISLKGFLLSESIDLRKLVSPWSRICDVPKAAEETRRYSILEAFRHINTFRNRFAHVPFPYDAMDDLRRGLESVTEELFTTEPLPWIIPKDTDIRVSPLCGNIKWGRHMIEAHVTKATETDASHCSFCHPPGKKEPDQEAWNAEPFVYVDSMLRTYVLTRLRNTPSDRWEFTRFRAESNSVVFISKDQWDDMLPAPCQSEYITDQDRGERKEAEAYYASRLNQPPERPSPDGSRTEEVAGPLTFDDALRYIRNEDYKPAIEVISSYVKERPDYHIGWLKLGNAQREYALRVLRREGVEVCLDLLDESIDSLTKATGHRDSSRKAQAFYERSKSYYHKSRNSGEIDLSEKALKDAKKAFETSPDYTYESWLEYLEGSSSD